VDNTTAPSGGARSAADCSAMRRSSAAREAQDTATETTDCTRLVDEIISLDLIDFEPKEQPNALARQVPDFVKGER
jgi:hypothetical protein